MGSGGQINFDLKIRQKQLVVSWKSIKLTFVGHYRF